jgi:gluconokinase
MSIIIVMGVAGCGKSTVGQALAKPLNWPFYDGDAYHPPQNVAKMAAGTPLDDADRAPWLSRLRGLVSDHLARGESVVLACSALKKAYRDQLRGGDEAVRFVYLRADRALIRRRLQERPDHYMAADMLESQFAALEEPTPGEALAVDAAADVSTIVGQILAQL